MGGALKSRFWISERRWHLLLVLATLTCCVMA